MTGQQIGITNNTTRRYHSNSDWRKHWYSSGTSDSWYSQRFANHSQCYRGPNVDSERCWWRGITAQPRYHEIQWTGWKEHPGNEIHSTTGQAHYTSIKRISAEWENIHRQVVIFLQCQTRGQRLPRHQRCLGVKNWTKYKNCETSDNNKISKME